MTRRIFLNTTLPNMPIKNARVLLRADLNVPLEKGTIVSDFRLKQILPTIDYIQKNGGKVILLTHIGRPSNQDPMFSTQTLVPWFEQHGKPVTFVDSFDNALIESKQNPERILLFENLRFFAGEKQGDENFARSLAALGDFYVNEAFGTIHRSDCSITKLPALFAKDKRTIGFLMERELATLSTLLDNPKHPFVFIIGGGKAQDKIPLINHLLPTVNTILLGPAVVFSFMHALGEDTGKSLVDVSVANNCREILERARTGNKKVIFPIDYQVQLEHLGGATSYPPANEFPEQGIGTNVGPETIRLFGQEIAQASTVFFNGLMGINEHPETLEGTRGIFEAMIASKATTIVGGGDLVGTAEKFGYADKFSHCSTGGGATLALLSNEKLPGIEWALEDRAER